MGRVGNPERGVTNTDMREERSFSMTGPAIAAGVLLFLLAVYVAGYLLMGSVGMAGGKRFRVYDYSWQEVLYRPAATAETFFSGREVIPAYRTPDGG